MIFEDVMHSDNTRFYLSQYDGTGAKGASLEGLTERYCMMLFATTFR